MFLCAFGVVDVKFTVHCKVYSKCRYLQVFLCTVQSVNYYMRAWRKKTLRSSQDLNLGPLNSSQMLLPMSYWSSGIGAEDRWHLSIDTVRFSGWISLRLGELCMISTKLLVLSSANWVIAAATLYVPSEPSFIGANRKYSTLQIKTPFNTFVNSQLLHICMFTFSELC